MYESKINKGLTGIIKTSRCETCYGGCTNECSSCTGSCDYTCASTCQSGVGMFACSSDFK